MSRKLIGGGTAALIAAGALTLMPSPAEAGEPQVSVKIAKQEDGPFKDELRGSVPGPGKRNFYVKVKNIEGVQFEGIVEDVSTVPGGWSFRWFKGQTEVTDEVIGGGLELTFKSDKPKIFRVKVRRGSVSEAAGCFGPRGRGPNGLFEVAFLGINQPVANCLG